MDRETLDRAYSNTGHVGEARFEEYLEAWTRRSQRVNEQFEIQRDLRYGSGPRETLDFISCASEGAPTLAFIHGGYWQWMDKSSSLFLAEGLLPLGFHFANIEYQLAPAQSLAGIVTEIRQATRYLHQNLTELTGGHSELYICGHSAGGQLTALALEDPSVAGGLAISGLFDLLPIRLGSLNDGLRLDDAAVETYSPINRIAPSERPLLVAVGAAELPELRRQSEDYAAACQKAGRRVELISVEGADHFSVLDALASPEGLLARSLQELASARRSSQTR